MKSREGNESDKVKSKVHSEFEEVINRFSRFIQASIQRFDPQKSGIEPDDLFQEVKIKLWKVLENEKKIKHYSSYIKKVVNSTIIDCLRKLRRENGIINRERQEKITEGKCYFLKDSVDEEIMLQNLNQAVSTLRETRQRVVRLFFLDLTIEEIALFLNWSKDKTRNLLYRGLADLKKRLKEWETGITDQ